METAIERRSQKRSRDAAKTSGRMVSGYAARFDMPTKIGGTNGFIEVIRRGAFARCIRERQDVRCLLNHDPNHIVGRTTNGTLTLAEDERGLKFRCDVANTQVGNDLLENLRTQNLSGCSFSFSVPSTGGDRWSSTIDGSTGKRCDLRELLSLDLYDVSTVVYPAYGGTSAVRDIDEEDDEDEDDGEPLATLAATAASSRSMPIELRSAINKAIECHVMTPEERVIYTRALMLEIQADR